MMVHLGSRAIKSKCTYLQGVLEELVHLGDLSGNAEVDGTVTNFDDETTPDIRVDLS